LGTHRLEGCFADHELVHVDVDLSAVMGPTHEFSRDEAEKVVKQLKDQDYL